MRKVLVIVVTYNGMQWLDRCLGSVYAQADLYVWDNDSSDGSADYVAANFPQAKLVRSAENLGFAKANNQGFRYALEKGYDYVYLLNQDAWLEAGALDKLVAAAEAHPEYAVLSPLQMTDGFKNLDIQFEKVLGRRHFQNLCHPRQHKREGPFREGSRSDGSERAFPPEPVSVKRVMAAHWLVPVEALRTIGLFNEELFPLYGQDDDWCNRVRYHGRKVGVVPQSRGVHDRLWREESKEKLILRNYYTGSLVRLCDINRPLWDRFCFVCLFTLVKTVKYRGTLVLKYFNKICRQLSSVRKHRAQSR